MKKLGIFAVILAFLLVLPVAQAAVISGNIYDINLNPAENTVIKITTTPEQIYVSKDSIYTFSVPEGQYIITASYEKDSVQYSYKKQIKVVEEGTYVLDIILYPGAPQDTTEEPQKSASDFWFYFSIIVFIAFVAFIIYKFKSKFKKKPIKKEDDELTKQVLNYIKEQGGRVTQKDIRKKFPMSEAKISLVITELEHKGIVQKIKKGRGNIIILKQ